MKEFLWVCSGSALGGGLRYLVAVYALRMLGPGFPFGTLFVNVTGSFLIGAVMVLASPPEVISPQARVFLATGFLGGLTTYSAFNYDTLELARTGAPWTAALNAVLTVSLCLVAGGLGIATGRLTASMLGRLG